MRWDDKEKALGCLEMLSEQYMEYSRRAVEEEKRDEYRDISGMLSDALYLLTEDEETSPVFYGDRWGCEKCSEVEGWKDILQTRKYKYCPGCGRKIVWECGYGYEEKQQNEIREMPEMR